MNWAQILGQDGRIDPTAAQFATLRVQKIPKLGEQVGPAQELPPIMRMPPPCKVADRVIEDLEGRSRRNSPKKYLRERILEFLSRQTQPMMACDVAVVLGVTTDSCSGRLSEMFKAGLLRRVMVPAKHCPSITVYAYAVKR